MQTGSGCPADLDADDRRQALRPKSRCLKLFHPFAQLLGLLWSMVNWTIMAHLERLSRKPLGDDALRKQRRPRKLLSDVLIYAGTYSEDSQSEN